MAGNLNNLNTQASVSYENTEEETFFEPLKNILSELNIVIAQFLEIEEDECEDRDGFFPKVFPFKNGN